MPFCHEREVDLKYVELAISVSVSVSVCRVSYVYNIYYNYVSL